jgi:hypothetical protein
MTNHKDSHTPDESGPIFRIGDEMIVKGPLNLSGRVALTCKPKDLLINPPVKASTSSCLNSLPAGLRRVR